MPSREEMLMALKGPESTSTGKPSREEMLMALKGNAPQAEEPGLGAQAFDYGMRALDYAGGLSRTTLAQMADTFTDKNSVTGDDFMKALKGKAPGSEELLGRFDIPEGASVQLPFLGETSVRDVGGFALDVAADPLTYLSLGALPGAKYAAKGLNVAKKPLSNLGKKVYKSGFKNIDEALANKGKKELSEIMLERGVTGTTKNIEKQANKIADNLLAERTDLINKLDGGGARVDFSNAFDDVIKQNDELRRVPGQRAQADDLAGKILEYADEGQVPLAQATKAKTMLYDSLPQSAYNVYGPTKGGTEFTKNMSKAIKDAIEKAAEESSQGAGSKIAGLNEDLGTLLSSRKPLQRQVGKATTKDAFTSVDGGLAAINPLAALTKKGADLSKTTYFRTKLGKGLKDTADSGVADILLRNLLQDRQKATNTTNSPWLDIAEE